MAGIPTLADTNVTAEPLRRVPNTAVARRLHDTEPNGPIAAPALYETGSGCCGCRRHPDDATLSDASPMSCARSPILPYDEASAEWHARQRARPVSRGRPPPFADSQIAAVAAVNGLVLATLNVRDFVGFEDLEIEG